MYKINKDYLKMEFEGDEAGHNKTHFKKKYEKNEVNLFSLEDNKKIDADFKGIIFPEIIESVKYELSHNLDDDKAKRIVFCFSYLQLHIGNSSNYDF